jgi:cytochrome c
MKHTSAVTAALAAMTIAAGAQAQDPAKLAQEKGCLACHQVDKKLVGPAYKEVGAKYRTDKEAMAKLTKKVREGSQGVWGPVPMPPNPSVSEKDAQALVKWVLSQK